MNQDAGKTEATSTPLTEEAAEAPPAPDPQAAATRILVTDDDDGFRAGVVADLRRAGFDVAEAAEVATARRLAATHRPDLGLVDIVMPGTSGKVFCRELAESSGAAIIMMSSLGDAETIAALLELGADDYIVKPFEPVEMLARVRAVLRRHRRSRGTTAPPGGPRRIGPWLFDPAARRLVHDEGRSVALTPGEIGVLRFLAANPGVIFSREDLLAVSRTRQHGGAGDRSVDNLVKRLRRKIEPVPDEPRIIVTEWGKGYRFDPPI
ncbi:MAG: response regulator transcription factor [Pseudomonadota bacterium]